MSDLIVIFAKPTLMRMEYIESLIADGRYDEAMVALDSAIAASDMSYAGGDKAPAEYLSRLYFVRGKLNWRFGCRAAAVNDYSMSVSIDPMSPAATALAQAKDINDFHAPDLYNP